MTKKTTEPFFLSTEIKELVDEKLNTIKGKKNLTILSAKYYYIIHLLYSKRIFHKKDYASKGVAISTKVLSDIFGNYRYGSEILNNLQSWGIINMEHNYNEGKARRYKLTSAFEESKIFVLNVESSTVPFITELIKRSEKTNESSNFVKAQLNILNKKVSVSIDGIDFLCKIYPHLSELFKTYSAKTAIVIPTGTIIYQRDIALVSFLTKDFFCVRPNKENRLFSSLTSLKSEYRPFLLLDGEPLIGTDLVNSQLLFTVPLVEAKLKEMNQRLIYIPADDFRKFKHQSEIGEVYESISKKIGFPILKGDVRTKFKKRFYSDFYFCKLSLTDTVMNDLFKELYPSVHSAIVKMKTDDKYNQFAISCQKNESYIILDKVYSKLLKKRIAALTLHDSIYVSNKKDAAIVKALIEEVLFKEHKLKVTVTTKIESIDRVELNKIIADPRPKPKRHKRKKDRVKASKVKVKEEVAIESAYHQNRLEENIAWASNEFNLRLTNERTVPFCSFILDLNNLTGIDKETGEIINFDSKQDIIKYIQEDVLKSYGTKQTA